MKKLYGVLYISSFILFLIFFFTSTFDFFINIGNWNDVTQTEKNLEIAKKGYLRIRTTYGGSGRTQTKSAYGYIEGVDSLTKDRRVIVGIGGFYSDTFKKAEGELIPIWYNLENDFVLARVFETQKKTIQDMTVEMKERQDGYIKSSLIFFGIFLFFYLCYKILSRFVVWNNV